MKLFLGIWVLVIIFGWVLLFVLSLFGGGMAPLLLGSLIIAALIRGLVAVTSETEQEIEELRQRITVLEDALTAQSGESLSALEETSSVTKDEI